MIRPDDKPACAGLWDIFDSRLKIDHDRARKLCLSCPIALQCRGLLEQTMTDYPGAVEGTWAGEHFNPTNPVGRPRKAVA